VRDDDRKALVKELRELVRLAIKILKRYVSEFSTLTTIHLTTEGPDMTTIPVADYPLTEGDSVVVTITDTDDVTGAVVALDEGGVTAELSSDTDTVVVDPSGTFLTITAGDTPSTGNTVTVNGTVNGVAATPGVGTYDVVAAVTQDPTTISLAFGTESAPATAAADFTPGGEGDPEYRLNEATGTYDHV
jgi:hypothetical protein